MNWMRRNNANLSDEERLHQLMYATRPEDPDNVLWNEVLGRIEKRLQSPAARPASRNAWPWLGACSAAAAAVAAVLFLHYYHNQAPAPPIPGGIQTNNVADEPLPVAVADEIEILSVGGADTQTLVVGNPPVDGPLELLAPGDVTLFSVEPADDDMVPEIRFHGPNSPIIWAQLDDDND